MPVTVKQHTPEDVLVATLFKAGVEVRLRDDFRLAKIFNSAADSYGGIFRQFRWHPQYRVSRVLSETLQILDQAGVISRENAAQMYFRPTQHGCGLGERRFDQFEAADQEKIERVASELRELFQDGPSGATGRELRAGEPT